MKSGWRLLLAGVLGLWQPASFAARASRALPSLGFRGSIATAELLADGAIAAMSVAAAWSLLNRAPHAVSLARLALVLSAARGVQSLYWTRLPSDVVPGTEALIATVIVAHAALWLVYLSWSRRTAIS